MQGSERSFSTARRLKSWIRGLRSSINQIRFNNLATLMIHSDRTANIGLDQGASEFASIEIESDIFGRIDIIVPLGYIHKYSCMCVSLNNFHMQGGAKK